MLISVIIPFSTITHTSDCNGCNNKTALCCLHLGLLFNIVLNKIEKKKKEVVTKAENNYLSSE